MSSETYNLYRRIRNGVETIPQFFEETIIWKSFHVENKEEGSSSEVKSQR
ncbi:hypothetical protein ACTNAL_05700 [Bariatricus sp. HCP28S3_B10]